jgi:hypothetical protein
MERAGSAELAPLSAWPRPSPAYSLVKQGDRHTRAQSVGALGVAVGAGRFYTDAQGSSLMLPSGPPMAALTNGGPLAETRRCISPHVFAVVMARSGRLLSALRPMAPSTPTRITRKTLEPRRLSTPRSRRRLTPRRGHVRRLTPPTGRGSERSPPQPRTSRALNPASARHCPAWPCAARFVRASYSAARLCPSRS